MADPLLLSNTVSSFKRICLLYSIYTPLGYPIMQCISGYYLRYASLTRTHPVLSDRRTFQNRRCDLVRSENLEIL